MRRTPFLVYLINSNIHITYSSLHLKSPFQNFGELYKNITFGIKVIKKLHL